MLIITITRSSWMQRKLFQNFLILPCVNITLLHLFLHLTLKISYFLLQDTYFILSTKQTLTALWLAVPAVLSGGIFIKQLVIPDSVDIQIPLTFLKLSYSLPVKFVFDAHFLHLLLSKLPTFLKLQIQFHK